MSDWKYLYKIDYLIGRDVPTNMLYTPMTNSDRTVMCMLWDAGHDYQADNKNLTTELVNFFFEREVKYLKQMQKYAWSPKLLSIKDNKIYIEGYKETLNQILLTPGRDLDEECPTWKEQIFNIIKDILNEGCYKLALYPHCFFLKDGLVKTFDFYSCVGIEERYISRKNLNGMIGNESTDRFNLSTVDDQVDFKMFFEITMTQHLGKTWKDNPFPEFYKRLI